MSTMEKSHVWRKKNFKFETQKRNKYFYLSFLFLEDQ